MKRLEKLKRQKNEARRKLRLSTDMAIRAVARDFHRLLRLHSRESHLSLKTRAKLEALKACRSCAKSFWRLAAQLLDEDKPDVSPAFNINKAESFFRRLYSSEPKEFEKPAWLPTPPSPATPFNEDFISNEEIQQAISNSKSWSTPSPRDQVPYMILKRCPSLAAALLDLYNACWSSGSVLAAWKVGLFDSSPRALLKKSRGTRAISDQ